jgi:hypothetical protein
LDRRSDELSADGVSEHTERRQLCMAENGVPSYSPQNLHNHSSHPKIQLFRSGCHFFYRATLYYHIHFQSFQVTMPGVHCPLFVSTSGKADDANQHATFLFNPVGRNPDSIMSCVAGRLKTFIQLSTSTHRIICKFSHCSGSG